MNLWGWRRWITLWKKMKTRWHLPNTVEAQPHNTYTNLLPRSSSGCWTEWNLSFAEVSGDIGVLCHEDKAVARAEWVQAQIRWGTGSLPGPPQHWWLCPELLHGLEPPLAPTGQELLAALITGDRGGVKSKLEQCGFFPFRTAQASLWWPQIVLNSQLQLHYES